MRMQRNRSRATVKLTESVVRQDEELHADHAPTNVIGILGGKSTLIFAKKLVDQDSELPFVLCMDPELSNGILSLQKGSLRTKNVHIDYRLIVERLRCKRAILEKCGVCCIVMPCDELQSWYDEIKEGCSVPFIHMGESVANELKEARLRPIEAGSALSIGILAINTTMVTSMYQQKLENEVFLLWSPSFLDDT